MKHRRRHRLALPCEAPPSAPTEAKKEKGEGSAGVAPPPASAVVRNQSCPRMGPPRPGAASPSAGVAPHRLPPGAMPPWPGAAPSASYSLPHRAPGPRTATTTARPPGRRLRTGGATPLWPPAPVMRHEFPPTVTLEAAAGAFASAYVARCRPHAPVDHAPCLHASAASDALGAAATGEQGVGKPYPPPL